MLESGGVQDFLLDGGRPAGAWLAFEPVDPFLAIRTTCRLFINSH